MEYKEYLHDTAMKLPHLLDVHYLSFQRMIFQNSKVSPHIKIGRLVLPWCQVTQ